MNQEQLQDYADIILERQTDLLPIIDEWEGIDK